MYTDNAFGSSKWGSESKSIQNADARCDGCADDTLVIFVDKSENCIIVAYTQALFSIKLKKQLL